MRLTLPPIRTKRDPLTPREREVLKGALQGKTDKEMAAEMRISESTVGSHVQSILKKLRAKSRTQAAGRWLNCCL